MCNSSHPPSPPLLVLIVLYVYMHPHAHKQPTQTPHNPQALAKAKVSIRTKTSRKQLTPKSKEMIEAGVTALALVKELTAASEVTSSAVASLQEKFDLLTKTHGELVTTNVEAVASLEAAQGKLAEHSNKVNEKVAALEAEKAKLKKKNKRKRQKLREVKNSTTTGKKRSRKVWECNFSMQGGEEGIVGRGITMSCIRE